MTDPTIRDGHRPLIDKCWASIPLTITVDGRPAIGRCTRLPDPDDRLGLCAECGRRLRGEAA